MRRISLVFALLLLSSVAALADDGVPHLNQVTVGLLSSVAAGTTSLDQSKLTYAYQNQWGLKETWQLQGTTIYYWKSVHTSQFHDQARAKLAGGGSLTALESTIFELPYGEYDHYYKGTLSVAEVRALMGDLATERLPDAPARVGCGEKHWEIALDIAGKRTHIYDVNAPGNDRLAACIAPLQTLLRGAEGQLTQINRNEYEASFLDLTTASLTGH